MTTPVMHQQPTPERFFNALNAYELTEAMKAAIELDVFTAVAEGNTTSALIAKRCGAAERGARILCDFLTIHNFLTKQGGHYGLAPDSALFLDRHSSSYVGSAIEFLLTPRLRECHAHLTEAVRQGGTALGEGMLKHENPDWVKFAKGMMPMMHRLADDAKLSTFWPDRRQLGDWPTNSRMAVNDWWRTRFSADQGLRKGRPIWATWATKEGTVLAA